MELKIRIEVKESHAKYTRFVRTEFTDHELLEWAKAYIQNQYSDSEAVSVDVESIIP